MDNEALPFVPLDNETLDEKMEKEFTQFVEVHAYAADQIQAAYNSLMGMTEEGETSRDVPQILLEEMQRLEREHFPINRFAQFSNKLRAVEGAVPNYEHFVEELPVSFDEKYMLRSLVKKQRVGELDITVGGKHEAKILLKEEEMQDQQASAMALMNILKEYSDQAQSAKKSIEFLFTE